MIGSLQYVRSSRAWYWRGPGNEGGQRYIDEIIVQRGVVDDGVVWEFVIHWYEVGSDLAMRVEIFDEALDALIEIPGFWERLTDAARSGSVSPELVEEILIESGIGDVTEVEDPHHRTSRAPDPAFERRAEKKR